MKNAVLPSALAASTRIAEKLTQVAISTQEADGCREKAMMIVSVEQVELANIIELSIIGHVLKWARQPNISGGLSLSRRGGWNLRIYSSVLVSSKDQNEERSKAVLPQSGKDASTKKLSQGD